MSAVVHRLSQFLYRTPGDVTECLFSDFSYPPENNSGAFFEAIIENRKPLKTRIFGQILIANAFSDCRMYQVD